MRIVGTVDGFPCKISIFHFEDRISIKFEDRGLEQIYKFKPGSKIETAEDVRKWIDAEFVDAIMQNFMQMRKVAAEAGKRNLM